MKQTDNFGTFNADIQKFDGIQREMIIHCTTKLRRELLNACREENQRFDLTVYIGMIIQDYKDLAHLIHSFYHW